MLAEIPFPPAADPTLGLIETMLWSREGGYGFEAEHLARLSRSAAVCGFALSRRAVGQRLAAFAAELEGARHRVRLVLFPDGRIEVTAAPLGVDAPRPYRVAIAAARNRSDDPWLRHKTTRRDRYERPLAEAVRRDGADEVLFLNERDELCEGARTNLFVAHDEVLLTPPLGCGLLPGTLRAHLIEAGQATEAVLRLADIGPGVRWFLGNSVRGLVPSTLVASETR